MLYQPDFIRSLAMSFTLVKKSLSLFEDDLKEEPVKKKKKKAKDPMSLISTKKKGVKKELLKLKKQEQEKKQRKPPAQSKICYESKTSSGYTDMSSEMLNRIFKLDSINRDATSKLTWDHDHGKKRKAVRSTERKKRDLENALSKTTFSDNVKHKDTGITDTETQDGEYAFTEKDFEEFSNNFDFSELEKS